MSIPAIFLANRLAPAGTVLVFCEAHTQRDGSNGWVLDAQRCEIGPLVVVREDGSTSEVEASQVNGWIYHRGQWMLNNGVKPQPGNWMRLRFPGEEWPPQD